MSEGLEIIRVGFLPLLDSVVLIVAEEHGFAAQEGLHLELVRENSWASIRDRITVGHFDVAHMLAPMPVAATLGLAPLNAPMIAPMALGLGGNTVTVSAKLWQVLAAHGAKPDLDAHSAGAALKRTIPGGAAQKKLRLGVVHPHSSHNYDLRYWLAASGLTPDQDVDIVILPPPLLPDALAGGTIDGFCAGEPWGSIAVERGAGHILTTKDAIWRSSPEKVLGTTQLWAEQHPDLLTRLLRALYRAAQWSANTANFADIAHILAQPHYLNQPADILVRGLSGRLRIGPDMELSAPGFFTPNARAATFPWQSHALWFYSQMVRWRQVEHSRGRAELAARTFRPDLYRAALQTIDAALPGANAKVEGALQTQTLVGAIGGRLSLGPDGFFDAEIFDPEQLDRYIERQKAEQSA